MGNQKVYVWFDLDGTVYNLYKVENWLQRLRAEDETVYSVAGYARKSLPSINAICGNLRSQDVTIGVITWLGMDARYNFRVASAKEKVNWCSAYFPNSLEDNEFFAVPYGTPKHEIAMRTDEEGIHILVDDNAEVRKHWRAYGENFHTINANKGYLKKLQTLCDKLAKDY